jgi:uncharacterized protein (TIGR03067 family)
MLRPILAVSILLAFSSSAVADSCRWSEHFEGKSSNGRYVIRLAREGHWKGGFEDTKTGKVTEAKMEGIGGHIHSSAFVTDDGSRIVVFEPSVPHNEGGNLQVYDRELRLLKGFTLKDLLTEIDFKAVRYSVSHCRFMANGKDGKQPFWLDNDGKTFSIYLKSKRTAIVSLAEPKIIPTPDVIPEEFEFENGLPPGKNDQERFQGKWMVTDGKSGMIGTDLDSYREDPRYYTFDGQKISIPDCRFDKYTFRLDESVTPHAIDMFEPGKVDPIKGLYEFRDGKLLICVPDTPEKPRSKAVDAKGDEVEDWTITLQRRKPNK